MHPLPWPPLASLPFRGAGVWVGNLNSKLFSSMALKVKILHCQGVSMVGGINRGQPHVVSIRYIFFFKRLTSSGQYGAQITEQITFLASVQSTLAGRGGIDCFV